MKTDIKQLWDTVKFGVDWATDYLHIEAYGVAIHTVARVISCHVTKDTGKACDIENCLHLTKCKSFEEFEIEYKKMICPKIPWENEPLFCPYCGSDKHVRFMNSLIVKETNSDDLPRIFNMDLDEWQCHSDKCDGHSFFV